jgi:hypothetical protein
MLTWAAVVMILMSLPLLVNFIGRLQWEAKMAAEVQRRSEQIQKDETTLTQLRSALEYAKSDTYTERYAREQARLARPGEVVVVPPSMQDSNKTRKFWWEEFVTGVSGTATPAPNATAQADDKNR